MKKYFALFLALCMIFTLCACANNQAKEPNDGENTTTESKKIAGVVFFEDQFMKMLQQGYKDAAEAAGYEFFPGNTNNDIGKEVEFLNTYATQGYAGVAIAPTAGDASIENLAKAAEGGLVIGVANATYDNLDWMTGCFSSDDYQLGKMTGEACAKFVNESLGGIANVGILEFRPANAQMSENRKNGFLDALREGGVTVNLLADEDAWEQDKAITAATDIMTAHPEIDIIWAANEGGTVGAAMAISNTGRAGQVYAFGTDASEQTIALLQSDDNVLQALTGQDAYTIGVKTVESIIATIEGKENPNAGKFTIVPGTLLTREKPDEIASYLDNLKAITG